MKAFGDRLREAREAKGVSVHAVANSTRISERYLHALERSDLDTLPGGVFDKGYIKSYAGFLDIDPRPLLESYAIEERKRGRGTPEAEREKLEELARIVHARPDARGHGSVSVARWLAALVGIALASATIWWIVHRPAPAPAPVQPRSAKSATVMRSLSTAEKPPPAGAEPRAGGPSEPEPRAPAARPTSELTIPQTGVGTGIVDRNLVGRSDRFPERAKVWFWTRVVGGNDGDSVRHVWRHDGRVYMNARLPIGGSHWRTYSTLELPPGSEGEWTLEVRAADGTILAEERFLCVSPQEGT